MTRYLKLNPESERFHLPHIGQRILKTALAVFLCLIAYWLLGYRGETMPTEAVITAIICMQPYVRDSRTYAINRAIGTLVGAAWGLSVLLLLFSVPAIGRHALLLYAVMALGVLCALYSAVLVRQPDTACLAAIVFICIVIAFPDVDHPLRRAVLQLLDVLLGTAIAIAVNVFRLPRRKNRDLLFFLRTKDLAPDRFSHIPASALFRLNYLYNDGARICLMSEHAPAFFTLQMSGARLNTPMIVMDGAAIYDANENEYVQFEALEPNASAQVQQRLEQLGVSYFIYTIHNSKTCIFHHGTVRPEEQIVYDRMHSSPYRSYLEGEIYKPEEIVYLKVIGDETEMLQLQHRLRSVLPQKHLRAVVRPQAGREGLSSLYIYAHTATMAQAQKRLLGMLRERQDTLSPVPILASVSYRSERDAIHLLHQVEKRYEPPRWSRA